MAEKSQNRLLFSPFLGRADGPSAIDKKEAFCKRRASSLRESGKKL